MPAGTQRGMGLARQMSASGQTRSFGDVGSMSGLPESGHGWAIMGTRPNTTLADLFTLLFAANPFSAARASLRRWSSDEFEIKRAARKAFRATAAHSTSRWQIAC